MLIEFILIIITIIIFDYFIKKERNDKTKNIPGPFSLPLIGGAWAFMGRRPENAFEHAIKTRNNYGRFFKVWLFNRLFVFISDPNDLEVILSSPKYINKGSLYDLLSIWLGDGLLLSSGAKWHSRRKIITPTFHFKILEQFVEVFDQQSTILIEKLRTKANTNEAINIQPLICLEALDIITETAMGTKIHCQTQSENEYVKAVADILYIMASRFTNIWYRFDMIFSLFRRDLKIKQNNALRVLHTFTEDIIIKRRTALENSLKTETKNEEDDDAINSKKKMALLDILLQSTIDGKPLSNKDIREEVDTFVFEGHDTTTSGICSALYELSRNPDVQQKAFEEIKQVIGTDKNHKIELRELQDLKYLDCVIKETLRLYPPVPFFGRKLPEDCNVNGRILPANTNINVQIYAMQRDELFYTNANKFIPERYLTENNDKKSYVNIPFSAGPRNCIGQKFAMFEMKVTLLKMLQNFELLPLGPEMKLILTMILRSSNGVHLGLKER